MGIEEDLFDIGNGIRGAVEDVPGFVENVVTGDVQGAVTDGRKILGDVGDVLSGVRDLGVDVGKVPAGFLVGAAKLADSKILSGAQLLIEGQKKLTGDGDSDVGGGYRESASKLAEAVEVLIDAEVNPDLWDGKASLEYDTKSQAHRRFVSNAAVADHAVGQILATEAGQVNRTRQTLDSVSQNLYNFGLATAWMSVVPGAIAAKAAADTAAAATALATTNTTMTILIKNSIENATRLTKTFDAYAEITQNDTSGDGGSCGTFVEPEDDQRENLPTRLDPRTPYTRPEATTPPVSGPPARPRSY